MKLTNEKKKDVTSFLFNTIEVYYERTVKVKRPVHSLLSTKSQQKCNA